MRSKPYLNRGFSESYGYGQQPTMNRILCDDLFLFILSYKIVNRDSQQLHMLTGGNTNRSEE
jgi:hypothetical protein